MLTIREKVIAYITHHDPASRSTRLLVFSQRDAPEAGIQVPAGTVEPGEAPDAAVLREAHEETGLDGLELVRFLGMHTFDLRRWGKAELHRRHVYHLRCPGTPPERWHHTEPDPHGADLLEPQRPIVFDLSWATLPDGVPELSAEQDIFLSALTSSSP